MLEPINVIKNIKIRLALIVSVLFVFNQSVVAQEKARLTNGEVKSVEAPLAAEQAFYGSLGQKIMLDLRYFCDEPQVSSAQCRKPMTKLPASVKSMLVKYNIGGVLLFSENLQDAEQIKALTDDLQSVRNQYLFDVPLFIAIDQEGGRVARLPRASFPALSGNMAIGATYEKHGVEFAARTGTAIGKQLSGLGINVNFAPNVDVNSNPENPVINIRSFSDDPNVVTQLAQAQVKGMAKHNVISTLKHFPGHGDTKVDSHTGLPRVNKSQQQLNEIELLPFRQLIADNQERNNIPLFVMTAHIQFPALDNSQIVNKDEEEITVPATFSFKIINELLRKRLGFDGIIISDALDMGAITQHVSAKDAVIKAFNAGVDIALMPMAIRTPADLEKLEQLYQDINKALRSGELLLKPFTESKTRIIFAKRRLQSLSDSSSNNLTQNNKQDDSSDNQLADELAQASLVSVFGGASSLKSKDKVLVVLPDTGKCAAWQNELTKISPSSVKNHECYAITEFEDLSALKAQDYQRLIIGSILPKQSGYEMVGTISQERRDYQRLSVSTIQQGQQSIVERFQKQRVPVTWWSMRMPTELNTMSSDKITDAYASFNYDVYETDNREILSPTIRAFLGHLFNERPITGNLPLKVDSVCPKSLVSCAQNHSSSNQ